MPEGDTVWLAAQRLHAALAGRVLTRTDFRVPQHATADLSGREVLEVVPRGKHLLTRIHGGVTLHTHLRMDGAWHIYRAGARWTHGPAWQVRIVLENADWQAVGHRMPIVEILPSAEESRAVGHLGPDLLGAEWDEDEAVRRLAAQPRREIGEALLDQTCLAGIGNLYKSETLFLAGVHPWRPVDEVDLTHMVRIARRLMLANREHPEQSTTGSLRHGEQHWVYRREDRPCRRCGARIRRDRQGPKTEERATFWCATCQPGAPAVTQVGGKNPEY